MIILNQVGLVLCSGSMDLWKTQGVTLLCDMTQPPTSLLLGGMVRVLDLAYVWSGLV